MNRRAISSASARVLASMIVIDERHVTHAPLSFDPDVDLHEAGSTDARKRQRDAPANTAMA
jgi:hypothetical protein